MGTSWTEAATGTCVFEARVGCKHRQEEEVGEGVLHPPGQAPESRRSRTGCEVVQGAQGAAEQLELLPLLRQLLAKLHVTQAVRHVL